MSDALPQIIWTRYFLEAQGYGVKDSVVFQDNQSAILLEQNGKASSGRRTRHINIRNFFVKDRIGSGDMRVTYCPTEDMVADFFTKPLQGAAFIRFRNFLLNVDSLDDSSENLRSVLGKLSTGTDKLDKPGDPKDKSDKGTSDVAILTDGGGGERTIDIEVNREEVNEKDHVE